MYSCTLSFITENFELSIYSVALGFREYSLIPDADMIDFFLFFVDILKYIGRNLRVLHQYRFPETHLVQYT